MMAIVEAMLALALIVGGGSGAVYAMQNSLPGSPLYGFKLDVEDIRLEKADNPEARFERAMAMAHIRVEEALRLVQNSENVPAQVTERYGQNLAAAMAAADECADPEQARARLADELDKQLQRMDQVRNQVQDAGQCEEAERPMLQVLEKAQQRSQMNQATPKGDQEPRQDQERIRTQEHQETGDSSGTQMQPQNQEQQQNQQQMYQQEQRDTEQGFQDQTQLEPQTQNQEGEASQQPESQNQNQTQSGSQTQNQQGESSPQPELQTRNHQVEGSPQYAPQNYSH